ncbi:MAG: M23 family metallopeptidase [Spirochaetaceae bacterium]|nr:M23 family metallopeptidase [Spirochaetaceae bacterium]
MDSATENTTHSRPFVRIMDGGSTKHRRPAPHKHGKKSLRKHLAEYKAAWQGRGGRQKQKVSPEMQRAKPNETPHQDKSDRQASRPAVHLDFHMAFKGFYRKIADHVPRRPYFALIPLAILVFVFAGARVFIGATNFPVSSDKLILPDEDSVQAALFAYLEPEEAPADETATGSLPPVPVSLSLRSYTVRSGDTIDRIAKRFGLRQDTLVSLNNLQGPQSIRPGVQLKIPNMDGVSHKVRRGDSLLSLAKAYGADMTRIVDANDLSDGMISAGESLFIPNARLSSATMQNFYGDTFIWPARGGISSPFGYRSNPFTGLKTYHSAIDIVVSMGTKVKATRAGTVADTGYNSVFGNYIILKHSGGYQSLYGHLSTIGVREGASVTQGAVIGNSGNTGQSTGPHLHFSIFKNGKAVDPRKYVK